MGKKETKVVLDRSDDQCAVELEPLNAAEVGICFHLGLLDQHWQYQDVRLGYRNWLEFSYDANVAVHIPFFLVIFPFLNFKWALQVLCSRTFP